MYPQAVEPSDVLITSEHNPDLQLAADTYYDFLLEPSSDPFGPMSMLSPTYSSYMSPLSYYNDCLPSTPAWGPYPDNHEGYSGFHHYPLSTNDHRASSSSYDGVQTVSPTQLYRENSFSAADLSYNELSPEEPPSRLPYQSSTISYYSTSSASSITSSPPSPCFSSFTSELSIDATSDAASAYDTDSFDSEWQYDLSGSDLNDYTTSVINVRDHGVDPKLVSSETTASSSSTSESSGVDGRLNDRIPRWSSRRNTPVSSKRQPPAKNPPSPQGIRLAGLPRTKRIPESEMIELKDGTLDCPACKQHFDRHHDLKRHHKGHSPKKEDFICRGVPLDEALQHNMIGASSRPTHVYQGVTMVGGCLLNFSRGDALQRHLKGERKRRFVSGRQLPCLVANRKRKAQRGNRVRA